MTTDVRIDKTRATDYETIFILRADIDSDASERAISRAVSAVEQNGGTLLKIETWGKRRLAYPVAKQRKGFYVYLRFLGYRGAVAELERNLRMLDTVLRHMTVQLRKDVNPATVTVDPEEVKVRRIEITEEADDREDSVEASLGLADDQRPEPRRERRAEQEASEGSEAAAPEASGGEQPQQQDASGGGGSRSSGGEGQA
jgi:small subunit ribosomal protein S6